MTARTLYDKLWDDHVVHTEDDVTAVLYIDLHLVHEVTSPQAFDGLLHHGFRFGVEGGRGLIEDKQMRMTQKCTCDRESLLFSSRKLQATFTDQRIQSFFRPFQ